jgi:hypothetical protein
MNRLPLILALAAFAAAGCGSANDRAQDRPRPPAAAEDTLDDLELETMPASLIYPGSVEESHTGQSGEHTTTTTFLYETPDSLPAVAAFYQRALTDSSELFSTASGRMATFEVMSADGRPGTYITLLKKGSGTTILIMRWQYRAQPGASRTHG